MRAGSVPGESDRTSVLARLAAGSGAFDVLIVGAGINGAATFRDLALQGVSCLLVDREDFGAGASSASTRMAHGGLRYLENGELRLVAEATLERNRLLRNAPHAIVPLLVAIPTFSLFGGILASLGKFLGISRPIPSRGLALLKSGLALYDFLGRRRRAMPRHRIELATAARRALPDLHPAIRGVASYYDARISHAERIAVELVRDGLQCNPACLALNHCRLDGHAAGSVSLIDTLEGARYTVTPRLVINAAGAWIDLVNARLASAAKLIGGTKGSHLVIDNPELVRAFAGRAFSFDDGTGRMCIAYPLGGMVLLGSTDIRVDDPDEAVCDAAEIAYLLGAIRLIFPWIEVTAAQIRYRFCGVRPLPRSDGTATVNISRDHSIASRAADETTPFPILSLVGGKWTTFRAFAEQVTDRVLAIRGMTRRVSTADMPIGGGAGFPADAAARVAWVARVAAAATLAPGRVALLLERYGTTAEAVATFCAAEPDRPLLGAPEYSMREVLYLITQEMASTIGDIVYRRTTIAMWGRLSLELLEDLAFLLAPIRGVTQAELLREILPRLRRENGIDYEPPADPVEPGARKRAAVAA